MDAAFEKTLCKTTVKGYLTPIILESYMSPGMHQEKLEEYAVHVRNLCSLQLEVLILAFNAWDCDDLATKWLAASVDVRKKHVLIGIAGACVSSDGQILLELINAIAPHDLTEESAYPQYVNTDEWDKLQDAQKDSRDEVKKLGTGTHPRPADAHFIICSFLGHELPRIPVHKKPHSQNKTTPPPTPFEQLREHAILAKYGGKKVEEIKAAYKAAYKERTAEKIICCRSCTLNATTRETFKRCGACWKVDREVLYCSEKCQRANWKQHKLMCGKPLDYDMAVKLATIPTTSNESTDIVLPANSFKPTLELRLQMNYLKLHPTFEYLVLRSVYTNEEKYAMLTWKDPAIGPFFRLHRDKAIETGDHFSATLICDCVLWHIEVQKCPDFRREAVVDQFSRSIGFLWLSLKRSSKRWPRSGLKSKTNFLFFITNFAIFGMALIFFFEQSFGVSEDVMILAGFVFLLPHLFSLVDPRFLTL